MVIAVGLSSYNLALFHLVNHAFYKGLLFLGAGAVIHAWTDNQDFRKYGGLKAFLPLTYSVMLIASLSLVAFPFMTGFYSKDFILESAYGHFSFSSIVVYFIATIGAMFTTLYSVKVLYLTFLTNPNGPLFNYKKAHEGDIFMSMPLIVLAIFSIFFGYLTKDIFIGLGSSFFSDNSLFIHPRHEIMLDTEFAVSSAFKLLPLVLTIALSLISLLFSEFIPFALIYFKFSRLGYNVFSLFNQRFLIELFYNKYVIGIIFKLGGQTTKVLDKGSVELIGPFGLEKALLNISRNIAGLDSGVITSYALYILIGLVIYMLIPYFSLINSSTFLLIVLALYVSLSKANKILDKPVSLLEWGLSSTKRPHRFVSLPFQSYFFKFIIGHIRKMLIRWWYLLPITITISLGIRYPLITFLTFHSLIGSPSFYLSIAMCAIIIRIAISNVLNDKIIYKLPSLINILLTCIISISIAYIYLNYSKSLDSSDIKFVLDLSWLLSLADTFEYAGGSPVSTGFKIKELSYPSSLNSDRAETTRAGGDVGGGGSTGRAVGGSTGGAVGGSTGDAGGSTGGAGNTSTTPADKLDHHDLYFVQTLGSPGVGANTLGKDFIPFGNRHTGEGGNIKAGASRNKITNGALFILNLWGETKYESKGSHKFALSMAKAMENQINLNVETLGSSMLSPDDKEYLSDYLKDKYPHENYTSILKNNTWNRQSIRLSKVIKFLKDEK